MMIEGCYEKCTIHYSYILFAVMFCGLQKIRTIELDGKTVKLQIVS